MGFNVHASLLSDNGAIAEAETPARVMRFLQLAVQCGMTALDLTGQL